MAALVAVVGVGSTGWAIVARRASLDAARQSAALVAVRIGGPGGSSTLGNTAYVDLWLVNAGPRPIQLEAARLDVDGWTARLPAEPVGAGSSVLLEVRRDVDCATVDSLKTPSIVRLTVRSADGRVRPASLGFGPQDAADPARQLRAALIQAPRRACGVLPPGESMTLDGERAVVTGRAGSVLLVIPVANSSSRPLSVLSIRGIDGLEIVSSTQLPVVLRPRGRQQLGLVLTLVDCRIAQLREARVAIMVRGDGSDYSEIETGLGAAAFAAVVSLEAHRCR